MSYNSQIKEYISALKNNYDIRPGHKIALGLSGGVDSALSLVLLQECGTNVTCHYMLCWNGSEGCSSDIDYQSACSVAAARKAPIYKLDYIDEYRKGVFDEMTHLLNLGMTPNPDVFCNSIVKFGKYYKDMIGNSNYDFIATGHYANRVLLDDTNIVDRITAVVGIPLDVTKDQSYYLSRVQSSVDFNRVIFPLQGLTKDKVREFSKYFDLPNYDRPDSQGICFIGDINYRDFISKYVKKPEGEVVDTEGKVIGRHKGLHLYTIGQRHGFSLDVYTSSPLHVIHKDIPNNRLIVGPKDKCFVERINGTDLKTVVKDSETLIGLVGKGLKARIRSLGELVEISSLEIFQNDVKIHLKQPIFAPAPGQVVAFYYNNALIASMIITDK